LAELNLIPHSETEISGIRFVSERQITERFIEKKITVIDPQRSEALHFKERVARYRVTDFNRLFEKNGLTLESCFGNYQLDPFEQSSSPRLILMARKINISS
jgi:hypothetical protein